MNFDHFCIYVEGFDRLGRHLYGSWWSGNEHSARSVTPPTNIENEKQELNEQIEEILDRLSKLRVERRATFSTKRIAEIDAERETAQGILSELNRRLGDLPYNPKRYRADYDEYMRKVSTEEYLHEGLRTGAIMAWFGLSPMGMRWSEWGDKDGYVLYPELSMVRTPNPGHGRRMTVFFRIADFEGWLQTLEPINPERRPLPTLEEVYEKHMRDFVSLNGSDFKKPELREYIRQQEGHVQTNAFNRTYKDSPSIPNNKKRGGRPRKS